MKTQTKDQQSDKQDKHTSSSSKELKTDMPLSEKDEVKNAERRTQKALKNIL